MAITMHWTEPKWYANPDNADDVVRQDVSHPNAYIAVTEYDGYKNTVSFVATVYADSTKEEAVARISYTIPHNATDGAANVIRQAYMHLKTRPEFAGAQDC